MTRERPLIVSDLAELREFLDKEYRDEYIEALVRSGIAYQIRTLREKSGLTQKAFGRLIGKPHQSTVARLENTEYGQVNVQTLLDVAKALGIGLIVKFASYPRVLDDAEDISPTSFAIENIEETVARDSKGRATKRL